MVPWEQISWHLPMMVETMQILSDAYIRWAPVPGDGTVYEVPSPEKTAGRDKYYGMDMPGILGMIKNTISSENK